MIKQRKLLILLAMIGFVVSLDQLTKIYISEYFKLGETKVILNNFFNLTLVHNPGAAFGIFANLDASIREPFFLAVPILTLMAILYVLWKMPEEKLLGPLSMSCIVSGAIGNLIDRIRVGYVIDFLDFHWSHIYHFPAFNVADSAITIGVGILILEMFLESRPATKRAKK